MITIRPSRSCNYRGYENWDTQFLVPLGVGAHLEYWGYKANKITEMDWWDAKHVNDIEIVATPARHASGRLIPQSNKTLWSGFALIGPAHRVYYSGDTWLFSPGFKDIGSWLGPFDVTLIETGQYNHFGRTGIWGQNRPSRHIRRCAGR